MSSWLMVGDNDGNKMKSSCVNMVFSELLVFVLFLAQVSANWSMADTMHCFNLWTWYLPYFGLEKYRCDSK